MNAVPFADIPDDIDFADEQPLTVEQSKAQAAQRLDSAKSLYTSKCPKCEGGTFYSYSGRAIGPCYHCKGTGKLVFKTSPEARAKSRQSAADRKARDEQANLDAFAQVHPEQHAWIEANPGFDFATSMAQAIRRFGRLTDNQLAAIDRCIARAKERAEARAAELVAQAARATEVDAGALFAAFLKAAATGLRNPKLHFGEFKVVRASANGRNPGALYVIGSGDLYLGKIIDGRFHPSRDCTDEVKATVIALIEDPAAAVRAYGLRTGTCAICNRGLTAGDSIERGIGPVCAEKFGF